MREIKLTNTLDLEIVFYSTYDNGDVEQIYASYEEAIRTKGKENVKIGYMIVNFVTGEIPDDLEEIYPTIEDAINAIF